MMALAGAEATFDKGREQLDLLAAIEVTAGGGTPRGGHRRSPPATNGKSAVPNN